MFNTKKTTVWLDTIHEGISLISFHYLKECQTIQPSGSTPTNGADNISSFDYYLVRFGGGPGPPLTDPTEAPGPPPSPSRGPRTSTPLC